MPVNMIMVNLISPQLSGYNLPETLEIFKIKTPTIIQNGWIFWTPVSVVLFVLISSEVKRFYIFNCFAFCWQIYLAFKVNEQI